MKLTPLSSMLKNGIAYAGVFALSTLALHSHAVVRESANHSTASMQFAPSAAQAAQQSRQLIIRYNNAQTAGTMQAMGTSSMEAAIERMSYSRVRHSRKMSTGHQVYRLDENMSAAEIKALMAELQSHPAVASVEADVRAYPMFTPNDSRYNEQWHYFESTGGLNLPDAWDETTGTGVVVAVIDTGSVEHADLDGNLIGGYDMISDTSISQDGDGRDSDWRDVGDWRPANTCPGDPRATNSSWHGTHVAGTIAAETDNAFGVAGVAFGAKIVTLRALGRCGGSFADIADSIVWAAGGSVPGVPDNPNPAQVINMSLGGGGACPSSTQSAINTARSLGATIVVAAGNSSTNASNATPANCNGVVTVAATTRSGGRASFSNFGSVVDVAAPGASILSTLNTGTRGPSADTYALYSGTSMATPHVAGAAALLYAVDPDITPSEVESVLKDTARSFPASCSQCGDGIVDALAAVQAVNGSTPTPPTPTPTPPGGPEPINAGRDDIDIARNAWQRFTLNLDPGYSQLQVRIFNGSGDADLYVNFGSRSTLSDWDCRPYRDGNTETCTFNNPAAGTWHIDIRGFRAVNNVDLRVTAE